MSKRYVYENVNITRVIDGDTVEAMVDLGFDVWKVMKLRLYGINAPELKDDDFTIRQKAYDSKDYLEKLILNKYVKIESFGPDKYGRILATIYDGDCSINDLMIKNNMAVLI